MSLKGNIGHFSLTFRINLRKTKYLYHELLILDYKIKGYLFIVFFLPQMVNFYL
jgi:hypothetical protein